jgi:competence protein ComEC
VLAYFFRENPFIRLLGCCLVGFILGAYYPEANAFFQYSALILFICTCYVEFISNPIQQLLYRKYKPFLIMSLVVCLFAFYWQVREPKQDNLHYTRFSEAEYASAYIEKMNRNTPKYTSYWVQIQSIIQKDSVFKANGRVLVYVQHPDTIRNYHTYGQTFLFPFRPNEIPSPENPLDFNYKAYLEQQGIYHRLYVPEQDWILLDEYHGNVLFTWAQQIQAFYMVYFRTHFSSEVFAFISGLALGNADYIVEETVKDFRKTGTTHILSVSGLHVGIMYLAITFLLGRIPFKKWKIGYIVPIICITSLWFYAFLTGLEPSVMRSALMFSAMAWSIYILRPTSVYNIVCASALLILILNPLEIFNLGFQLSYLAVLGILVFQPKIAALFRFKYKVFKWTWELMAVSMAAQLTTLPIILYYFHQFPIYFVLSNLLIVPLSSFCLYEILAYMILYFIPYLNEALIFVITWNTKLVLFINEWIAQLPYATLDFIGHSMWMNFLFTLAMILLVLGIYYQWMRVFNVSLVLSALCVVLSLFEQQNARQNYYIAQIHKKDKQAYVFISPKQSVIYNPFQIPAYQLQFNIDPILSRYSIRDTVWVNGNQNLRLLYFEKEDNVLFFANEVFEIKEGIIFKYQGLDTLFKASDLNSVKLIKD